MKIYLTAAVAALIAGAAWADMPTVPTIMEVADAAAPADRFVICTGAAKGAYHTVAAQMSGLIAADIGRPVLAEPGGGTVGCLQKMARGEVQAAVIQFDALAWLAGTAPGFLSWIGVGPMVLTEDMMAVCRRDDGEDEFNDVAQSRGQTIAVAGGDVSGSLLTLNVLASFDSDFALPDYRLSGSWDQALQDVSNKLARCAFGVMSTDAPTWRTLNDDYGDRLRIVGFWDGDMRDLTLAGEQVYGWRAIPEDTKALDELLDWSGRGGLWAPEVGTVPAVVVYRTDMIGDAGPALKAAAETVANVKETGR